MKNSVSVFLKVEKLMDDKFKNYKRLIREYLPHEACDLHDFDVRLFILREEYYNHDFDVRYFVDDYITLIFDYFETVKECLFYQTYFAKNIYFVDELREDFTKFLKIELYPVLGGSK